MTWSMEVLPLAAAAGLYAVYSLTFEEMCRLLAFRCFQPLRPRKREDIRIKSDMFACRAFGVSIREKKKR